MDLLESKKMELRATKNKLAENELQMNAAKHDDSELQIKRDIQRMQEHVAKLLLEIEKRQNALEERKNSGTTLLDVQKAERKKLLAKQARLEAEIKELQASNRASAALKDALREARKDPTGKAAEILLNSLQEMRAQNDD